MLTTVLNRIKGVFRESSSRPDNKFSIGFAIVTAIVTFVTDTPRAYAQSERRPCPNLETGANSAEQALCWFEADRHGAADCHGTSDQLSACILQTLTWCSDAALDAAPVADACFLAYLRAGQLEDALAVAGYLQTPAEQARKCREALAAVTARVVTNPPGAQVTVDGKRYGRAPIEIKLTGNWWTKQVQVAFGSAEQPVEVSASREQLIGAFDKRACVMGDLVIEGPAGLALTPPPEESLGQSTEPKEASEGPFAGRLWTWIALGGAGAFGVAALVFGLQGNSQYSDLKKKCPDGCTDKEINKAIDDSGVKTSALLTNLSLGLSGACLAGAVALYFLEGNVKSESPNVAFSVGPGSAYLSGRF